MFFLKSAWDMVSKSIRITFLSDFYGQITVSQSIRVILASLLNVTSATTKVVASYALGTAFEQMALSSSEEPGSVEFLGTQFSPLELLYLAIGLQGFNQIEPHIKVWLLSNIGQQVSYRKASAMLEQVSDLHFQDYEENHKEMQFKEFLGGLMINHHSILAMSMYSVQPLFCNLAMGIGLTVYLEGGPLGAISCAYLLISWFLNEVRLACFNERVAEEEMNIYSYSYNNEYLDRSLQPKIRQLMMIFGRMNFELRLAKDHYLKKYAIAAKKYELFGSAKIATELLAVSASFIYAGYIGRDGFEKVEVGTVCYMLSYFAILNTTSNTISDSITKSVAVCRIIDLSEKINLHFQQRRQTYSHLSSRNQLISEIRGEQYIEPSSGEIETYDYDEPDIEIHQEDEKDSGKHENYISLDSPFSISIDEKVSLKTERSVKETVLSVKNLQFFNKNQKRILNNVNLDISSKELILVVGESGQGKTRLMELLMNFLKPHQGSVFLNNNNISTLDRRDIADSITYVPQEPVLFEDKPVLYNMLYAMTIDENILAQAYTMTAKQITTQYQTESDYQRCVHILKQCGLEKLIIRDNSKISGGEKKRVAIAMALAKRNKIILFDEATTNLDPVTRNTMIQLIINLKDTTRIIVTHNPEELSDYADKTYRLHDGNLTEVCYSPRSVSSP